MSLLPVGSVPGAETPLHVLHRRHLQVLLHVVQAVLGHVGDPKVVVRPHLSGGIPGGQEGAPSSSDTERDEYGGNEKGLTANGVFHQICKKRTKEKRQE